MALPSHFLLLNLYLLLKKLGILLLLCRITLKIQHTSIYKDNKVHSSPRHPLHRQYCDIIRRVISGSRCRFVFYHLGLNDAMFGMYVCIILHLPGCREASFPVSESVPCTVLKCGHQDPHTLCALWLHVSPKSVLHSLHLWQEWPSSRVSFD